MDNTNFEQLKVAFECISKDLNSVQGSLATYEAKMLEGDRVNPHVKEVVTYYRQEASSLRKEMLELCRLMSAPYKVEVLRNTRLNQIEVLQKAEAVAQVPTVAPAPTPVEKPVEPVLEQDDSQVFDELPTA
jgi:hypothetical protein